MSCSAISPTYVLALVLGGLSVVSADQITLGNSGQVQGVIEPSSQEGMIQLRTPLAPEPVRFKADAVSSLQFSGQKQTAKQKQMICLKNGDTLPAEVSSFADQQLKFVSAWASTHAIDKSHIDSLRFSSVKADTLYEGPQEKDWELSKGATRTNNAIRFQGWGTASWKAPELPSRYIVRWDLACAANASFKISLASDAPMPSASAQDCYTLAVTSMGLQLTRNVKAKGKQIALVNIQKMGNEKKKDGPTSIEIRIDRGNRLLQLIVDGKSIRNNIVDPEETGAIPTGSNYHFSHTSGGDENASTLRKFTVTEWTGNIAEAGQESRVSTTTDTLYDVESNRYSGELTSISSGAEKTLVFSNPHSPEPIAAPLESAAILYFKGESTKPQGRFVIRTSGSGALHVNEFLLENRNVRATHEILGNLLIPLTSIEEITRP